LKQVTKQDIQDALRKIGIKSGDILYVHANTANIGSILNIKNKTTFCQTWLDAIFKIIGDKGTLIIPTYTTQVGRYGVIFDPDKTPSLMGILSEHIRNLNGSFRSIHPIHSICAIGADATFFCTRNGPSDYGWDSPHHRFLQKPVKSLSIGLSSGHATPVIHHVEWASALPYVYIKMFDKIVKSSAKTHPYYFSLVRYLHLEVKPDLTNLTKIMRKKGALHSVSLGGGLIHTCPYQDAFEQAIKEVNKNPFCLLEKAPNFVRGKIPFDSITYGKDGKKINADEANAIGHYIFDHETLGGDL
tara:strand:+ start:576 stop:1478 length:903 start_codon:yes stop_codon:yes gene_type:complete